MSKDDQIKRILELTAGKSFKVLKARPSMTFTLLDKSANLFVNDASDDVLTWEEIQARYIINTDRTFWGTCSIADSDDLYFDKIWLSPVRTNEIIFFDEPFKYNPSIMLNINDYVDDEQLIS